MMQPKMLRASSSVAKVRRRATTSIYDHSYPLWIVFPLLLCCILAFKQTNDANAFRQSNPRPPFIHRRSLIIAMPQLASLFFLDRSKHHPSVSNANAFSFMDSSKDRRQLELCLVNLLRLQYWAISLSDKLQDLNIDQDMQQLKSAYLEARLGSKAMIAKTKKIGGGANSNVFMLKGLQLKDCLDDLRFYVDRSSKKKMTEYTEDLIEALASIVEFDGLETTIDPSPRSELTLKMFSVQKGVYVQRMLAERVLPITEDMFRLFGPDAKAKTIAVVREFYPKEVPESLQRKQQPQE
jgi:hypothetical protein